MPPLTFFETLALGTIGHFAMIEVCARKRNASLRAQNG